MRKIRILPLLLALLLAGSAAAPSQTPERLATPAPPLTSTPAPTETPLPTEPPAVTLDFSIDESGWEPWQIAYVAFLEALCAEEAPIHASDAEEDWGKKYNLSTGYCLYDVDEDGIPELFIKFGTCEADYFGEAYTYQEGEMVFLSDFSLSHAGFYTWPGKNAVLWIWGHMGVQFMTEVTKQDGKLVFLEDIFQEDINGIPGAEYTDEGDIVPGAEYLPLFRTTLATPTGAALTLPIYEYHEPILQAREAETAAARAAIEAVLVGEGKLFGIATDDFQKDAGLVTFEELCAPGVMYEYGNVSWTIENLFWLDLNGDGIEECVLQMEREREWGKQTYCVALSHQEGMVYAYYDVMYSSYVLGVDGVFYSYLSEYYNSAYTLSFYKNQCYMQPTAFIPDVPEVAWEQVQ